MQCLRQQSVNLPTAEPKMTNHLARVFPRMRLPLGAAMDPDSAAHSGYQQVVATSSSIIDEPQINRSFCKALFPEPSCLQFTIQIIGA
jgi:hypothetical protein